MRLTKIWYYLILIFCCSTAYAQQGQVKGTLNIEKGDGSLEPAPFANIIIAGTSQGSSTDVDGSYLLDAPAGMQRLVVSYVGYDNDTLAVNVIADETVSLNHNFIENAIQIAVVDIVAKADRENTAVLNIERQEADKLTQNIGSKELSRQAVSNAADGVKRIAGISLIGGRYFFVRGLGDRYNNATLNGLPVASPDPDRKVIPLDLFPSDVIGSLNVYKSFSPELYGDYAGGTVQIRTKEYTNDRQLKIGTGISMNTLTTFQPFLSTARSKGDFLGRSAISKEVPTEINDLVTYDSRTDGLLFDNNSNARRINAPVNNSFDVLYSDFFSTNGSTNKGLGVLLSAAFGNDYSAQFGRYKVVNKQNTRLDYDYDKYNYSTNSSLLGDFTYKFNNQNRIRFTSLLLNLSDDEARDAYGSHFDYAGDLYSRRFTYTESSLLTNQLSGTHSSSGGKMVFNWGGSYALANTDEPDRRQFVFIDTDETTPEMVYTFNSNDINENHRFYSTLTERELAGKLDVNYHLLDFDEEEETSRLSLRLGADYKSKTRDFDYRQLNINVKQMDDLETFGLESVGLNMDEIDTYFTTANHDAGLFYIDERDDAASEYQVNQDIAAAYANVNFDILPQRLKLIAGLRAEYGNQSIEYRNQTQPLLIERPTIEGLEILPALSLKFTPNAKNIAWLTASKTITLPGFKEVAQFDFVEFFAGEIIRGNAALQNSSNYNFDLRFEHYPSNAELISVSPFFKYLDDPIERLVYASSSGRKISFVNIDNAILAGLEVEFRKRLSFLSGMADNSNWLLGLNATYQYSNVTIAPNTEVNGVSVIPTTNNRPLQGASPYLVNASLSWETNNNTGNLKSTFTLVYGIEGPRIRAIGVKAQNSETGIGDVYEMPVHRLDAIWRAKVAHKIGIGVSAKNLLNPNFITQQETDNGIEELNNFTRGTSLGLSLSYDIF